MRAESIAATVEDFFALALDFEAFGLDLIAHTGFVAEAVVFVIAIVAGIGNVGTAGGGLCRRFCIIKPPLDAATEYGG